MPQLAGHEPRHSVGHQLTILVAALFLGTLIALFWITAAHGELDLPRAVVHWLTARKPESVSMLYDGLFWAALGCATFVAMVFLGGVWSSASNASGKSSALKGQDRT